MEPGGQSNPTVLRGGACVLLLVPVTLFIISLFIRPAVDYDPGYGFLAFRSMLQGGPFNNFTPPDPENIAKDLTLFLSWWSPGQYLVPGIFVWFGTDYGLAISLTTFIATLLGVLGWAQVARSFEVSRFVLLLFILGLVTFRYITLPFRLYNGGEVLLFAVLPWSLYALQWAADKPPIVGLAISVLAVALLFLAKLTGLVAFAATVIAISLVDVVKRRRLSSSLVAMWVGSGIAVLFFLVFWLEWGASPTNGPRFVFRWSTVWITLAGAAFSGVSGRELLGWLCQGPLAPDFSEIAVTKFALGPMGLLLMGWVWFRLRNTRYRPMAICLFSIIALYTIGFIAMYSRPQWPTGAPISLDERHLRYAGILFLLLLLVAIDQWRGPSAKGLAILIVGLFAAYGLISYANGERELVRGRHYDTVSGTSQLIVPPGVLEYLRSEMAVHNLQRAIAVVESPEAAISLPCFRIILEDHPNILRLDVVGQKWAGRAEKIFVIVQERMRSNGKAEALLKSFVDYEFESWNQIELDGMVIYSQ